MHAADSMSFNFTFFTMEKPTQLYLKDADATQKHLQSTQKSQTAQIHRRLTETQQCFLDIKTEGLCLFPIIGVNKRTTLASYNFLLQFKTDF